VIWGLFSSNKVKDFLGSWNISVHNWLKYYVYLRLVNPKERGGTNVFAAFMSFAVSAIWHGFYEGYYFFFFGMFIVDLWNKLATPVIGPLFSWMPDRLQDFGCLCFYYIPASYYGIAFQLNSFRKFHPVYLQYYYCVDVFFLTTIPVLMLL
jgi:hypothetical protein